ncbi:MAG TPA: polyprenyl synthetase family protein [Solirubrobacteraceae bacterium]|nr:polyprenyl synthetase family protein [Solirubrobacteraceae bacterium]
MEPGSAAPETAELVRAGGVHVPALLRRIEERLREDAAVHAGDLAEHGGATIAAGGKRLRPLLVLLAGGPPGTADHEDALVCAGAAVELVHSATLVHDDVLDAAALRRGRPTVVALAGRDMAVATGDALFARAFAALTAHGDPEAVRVLSGACSALARGELLQRAAAWDPGIAVDRYLLRCELKTARLFEAACRLGPLATGDRELRLESFARRIGLGFQILDDVLDVSGPAERTGKHRGTDLLDGTVTLPLILARERDAALAQVDLRAVTTPARAEDLCDRIAATGALDAARERALAFVADAKRDLDIAALGRARADALALVADSVVARYR